MKSLTAPIAGFILLMTLLLLCPADGLAEVNIQVLSVQDVNAARQEADRLFAQGVPAFVEAEEVPGKGLWNRVYVGPFETEAEARAAGNSLKLSGAIGDFILQNRAAQATAPAPSPAPALDPNLPVLEGGAAPPVLPAQSASLPVANTPTYGENISPAQARELGMGGSGAGALPTYGHSDPAVTPPPPSGPLGLQEGDTLPGLVGDPGATPPALGQGLPTYGQSEGQGYAAPPAQVTPPAPAPLAVPVAAAPAPVMTPPAVQPAPAPRPDRATPVGDMKIQGFTMLVDLSSSMRNMSTCQGRIKEEAVAGLLRKMNHRIPGQPYTAALRVFGYKSAWTRKDFTTTYFGPSPYSRDSFEDSIARLVAADSVSPFGEALRASDSELSAILGKKAVLMFADFEESMGSGAPVQSAAAVRRRYGQDIAVYTFHITRQSKAENLAKEIAAEGGGKSYEVCRMLSDENAFEDMMMEIFGPADLPPCADSDGDGVCNADDLCPNTPQGAPVDARGCWIAAYSQFFDFDKAVVKSAFHPRIEHAAGILTKNPNLPMVTIAGHTDNIGTEAYNMDLGRRRAQAVFDLMVKYGVPPERMTVESFGKTRPIAPNDTEEGRAQNRRVEFHIGDVPPAN